MEERRPSRQGFENGEEEACYASAELDRRDFEHWKITARNRSIGGGICLHMDFQMLRFARLVAFGSFLHDFRVGFRDTDRVFP